VVSGVVLDPAPLLGGRVLGGVLVNKAGAATITAAPAFPY
jgi:hypothetical protein